MHKLMGIVILLFALNCKSAENQAKMKQENIILIGKGNLYGSGAEGVEKQNLVITTTEEWKDLLNKINAANKVSDSFSETDIDFSEYTVIAVFDEIKNSGGHSLNLAIQETKEKILVEVLRKGPNGIATSVMTQPYYIVKIPKPSLPIVFE
ncbi:protease complex subunit PrcB family protein [Winogradskyella poriferorum]|uniref:Protease complex subunit PrcB family protein n=1 Tax=Winogradskyella poriferorum TaxID=307627 RepID=A0ABU7W2L9_9FLAO